MDDEQFPIDVNIRERIKQFVEEDCQGVWPEDEAFSLSDYWMVTVWRDNEDRYRATVHPCYRDPATGDWVSDNEIGIYMFFDHDDAPGLEQALSEQLAEQMDGDHESALASIGWGTDEDYFHGGGDE